MRILLVLDRLSARGGADRYALALAASLRPGHEVSVLYGHHDATRAEAAMPFSRALRFPPLARRAPQVDDVRDTWRLLDMIGASAPDRIVVQNVMSSALLHALAFEQRAILVIQDHRLFCPARGKVFPDGAPCREPVGPACDRCFLADDGSLDQPLRDERLLLVRDRLEAASRFSTVATLSRYMKDELHASGLPASQLHVIPPAVPEWAARHGVGPALGGPIGVIGRIAWHKGVLHLIRCLAGLPQAPALLLVGDGPARRLVTEASVEAGIPLRITGWLDDAAIPRALAALSIVALPSLWAEPFGIAGLEAAAMGLPVVAYDVGGVREWLHDGISGILVAPGDGPAFSAALASLLVDPGRRSVLGAAARAHVLARFSAQRFRRSWVDLLASRDAIIHEGGDPPFASGTGVKGDPP